MAPVALRRKYRASDDPFGHKALPDIALKFADNHYVVPEFCPIQHDDQVIARFDRAAKTDFVQPAKCHDAIDVDLASVSNISTQLSGAFADHYAWHQRVFREVTANPEFVIPHMMNANSSNNVVEIFEQNPVQQGELKAMWIAFFDSFAIQNFAGWIKLRKVDDGCFQGILTIVE